jgi:tRNA threonylcarbamoyl adenosine modification protein YeaZ
MLILTFRTDKPEAEIGLFQDKKQLAYSAWQAHRELAETIHARLEALLKEAGKDLKDIDGIIIFKGPGSFTGLRIGFSVANTLADSLGKPIVASENEDWKESGIERLETGKGDTAVFPNYGADPHITQPKH